MALTGSPVWTPRGDFPQRAGDSVEEPVNPRPRGHLLSVDDHCEALRVCERSGPVDPIADSRSRRPWGRSSALPKEGVRFAWRRLQMG